MKPYKRLTQDKTSSNSTIPQLSMFIAISECKLTVISYFNAVDRIAAKDYIPSDADVLRSRAKTTGIIETEFVVEKTKFK